MTDLRGVETRTAFREWNTRRAGEHRSLPRARALAAELGLLDSALPIIGVVGSKGKGTAAVYASALLARAGLRVGTLLSPGLVTNLDRIRLDGAVLSPDRFARALERTNDALLRIPRDDSGYLSPTGFFTLTGVREFRDAGCDVAVVEAGVGGRSDELSTLPLAALAVTEVFLEHTALLGRSIAEIAADKVGAARHGTRFVCHLAQSAEAERAIRDHAESISADVLRVDDKAISAHEHPLPPGHSARNAALGLETAAEHLRRTGHDVTPHECASAAASVDYPGRLSRHATNAGEVMVDSAVSRAGLASAIRHAREVFGADPELILVSLPTEKDYAGFVDELREHPSRVVFVDLPDSHLPYPKSETWPREWASARELGALLESAPTVLAVGTVSFSAAVLSAVGADTSRLF